MQANRCYMKELGVDILLFSRVWDQSWIWYWQSSHRSFRMAVLLCTFFSCRGESFATVCVQPLSHQGESSSSPTQISNNCSLWCDIDINDQTIRLFNNHLQTTGSQPQQAQTGKKNFVRMIPTVRNVPLSPLPMVCTRTSRNVPHKLNISINWFPLLPIPPWYVVTSTLSLLHMYIKR